MGYLYQRQQAYEKAAAAFEKVLAVDSADVTALYQIGRTLVLSESDLQRAEECFKRYLAESRYKGWWPDRAAAHWRLSMVYDLKGRTDMAIAELEKALELDPKKEEWKDQLKQYR